MPWKKNGHKRNSQDYLHSLDFVEAIKKAREYQPDKDALVIFAGACQSYYELLVASGANFASSPSRKNYSCVRSCYYHNSNRKYKY